MDQQTQEFGLRLRSKVAILFLFSFVGGPMLYAAYLNYQVDEVLFAALMVLLFLAWGVVILMAIGFKIKLTDSAIHREGLISPSIIAFGDIDAIHFGSTWSNFYVESDEEKIYFGKDFENYEDILHTLVDNVRKTKNIADVRFLGDDENIAEFTGPISSTENAQ